MPEKRKKHPVFVFPLFVSLAFAANTRRLIISFQSFIKSGTPLVCQYNSLDQLMALKPHLTGQRDKPLRQRRRQICGQSKSQVMMDRDDATELTEICNWNQSADEYPEKKHTERGSSTSQMTASRQKAFSHSAQLAKTQITAPPPPPKKSSTQSSSALACFGWVRAQNRQHRKLMMGQNHQPSWLLTALCHCQAELLHFFFVFPNYT